MLQKPKGTYDLYGNDAIKLLYLRKLVTAIMDKYNYKYFETPIFESSELFHRGVGETTDIVSKETYDFKDRGNRDLTLRPEGTAGVVRCFIENKLYAETKPLKAWYFGSMFRYERPQAGRFRQFNQFGVEAFGSNDPMLDAEVIGIVVNLFKLIGLKGIKVNINTLGDQDSRMDYRNALLEYFKPHLEELCDDCKSRYEKNPLRILDCKVDSENPIMKNAPTTIEYLNEESVQHFEKVKEYLTAMEIEYVVNTNLVRGLDYYTHTVFEVEADIKGFGSQNVLGGGGRYDSLVETMDGPSTPGVGFGLGLERIMTAMEYEDIIIPDMETLDAYVIPMSENEKVYASTLTNTLRMNGFNTDIDYLNRNLKSNFKFADKNEAKFIIIIGEEEIKTEKITVKDNQTKEEYKISLDELIEFLDKQISEVHYENK